MNTGRAAGTGPVKRFMYVNRRAPHGSVYALECLEAVLVTAAFDQDVSLVFVDDGVYQLKAEQDTAGIGTKDFSRAYRALDDHELIKVKLALIEREDRQEVVETLKALPNTELVQTIGKVALLYGKSAKPNPKLSNLLR